MTIPAAFSVDVEDWFHILDTDAAPALGEWERLETRVDRNVERLLELFAEEGVRVTFFWLGWVAERHRALVRRCCAEGHEIASHGYAHVLAYQVGPSRFLQDILRARLVLEDITGRPVLGLRAPGFGITDRAVWAFEVIRRAGYVYDSSVFPGPRGHGGMRNGGAGPHWIETASGALAELPIPLVRVAGQRVCLFGGGYLRLAPTALIRLGARQLEREGRPLIVYVHPREIDPNHPKLPLPLVRRFKCYVRLRSTFPKLQWFCRQFRFVTMVELAERLLGLSRRIPEVAASRPVDRKAA